MEREEARNGDEERIMPIEEIIVLHEGTRGVGEEEEWVEERELDVQLKSFNSTHTLVNPMDGSAILKTGSISKNKGGKNIRIIN